MTGFNMEWREWTALNRQLMDEWRGLLASSPSPSPAPEQNLPALHEEMAGEALTVFETGRGCTFLSPAWERLTGHACAASMRDAFYLRLHPDDVKPLLAVLMRLFAAEPQAELYAFEFRVLGRNGVARWFELTPGQPRRLENGAQRIACRLRDIQEIVTLRRQCAQAKQEAERALKARSEFLNGMSHELRTPLNAILGFTQIMERGMYGEIGNPQYRDYLRHIRESSYELLAQIDDVMDIASVDAGEVALHRDRTDLAELTMQTFSLHAAQAGEAQVALDCCVPARFATLLADRMKMQHCLSHLVANALRHSRPGGRIAVEAYFNDNDELCIAVSDDGGGMSARKLQALVGALTRDDSWSARGANGLGLGLPLAKEFARLHGGYLTLDSKAGEGTRVTVHLPPEAVERARASAPMKLLA